MRSSIGAVESTPVPVQSQTSADKLSLPAFMMRQEGESAQGKLTYEEKQMAKTEAHQQIFQEKDITPKSRGIYADVLTREVLAIKDLVEKGTLTPADWQQRLLDVIDTQGAVFKKVHGETALPQDPNLQYDVIRSVFTDLIQNGESGSIDEAREWLVTAMEVTKRQIASLQAVTGAELKVVGDEEDPAGYVDEIEVMSAKLAGENGRSVAEVRGELVALRNQHFGEPNWKNFIGRMRVGFFTMGGFLGIGGKKGDISKMWKEFNQQMGKDFYAGVRVNLPKTSAVNYSIQIDGQDLDPVQKKVIESYLAIGTRPDLEVLGDKGQAEVSRLLKDMIGAQQNAHFAEFDLQLTKANQLNLVHKLANGNYDSNDPGVSLINPKTGGITSMEIGYSQAHIDTHLDNITQNIGKRNAERLEVVKRSEVGDRVQTRITQLEAQQNRQLTSAEEAQKTQLEGIIAEGKKMAATEQEVARLDAEEKKLRAGIPTALTARGEKATAEGDLNTHNSEIAALRLSYDRKKSEVKVLDDQIKSTASGLGLSKTPAVLTGEVSRLEGLKATLLGELYPAATLTGASLEERISAKENEIKIDRDTISAKDAILTNYTEELASYDEVAKKLALKQAQLASLRAQYPHGIKVKQAERALEALTGTSSQERAQLEVLKMFKAEILDPAKWEAIQLRGYREKASNSIVKQELELAMDARPHVPPAYLFMLRSIGGKEAIANTIEGHTVFTKLSKMIPPQLFMQVYLSDPTRRTAFQAAFHAAHGRHMAPNDVSIFDEDFQDPAVRAAMLQGVNKEYIAQLTDELIKRARNDTLGVELDPDKDKLEEIAATEVSPSVEEKRKELADTVEGEKREYAKGMQAHVGIACEKALDVMAPMAARGLNASHAESVIRVVHEAVKKLGLDRDATAADLVAPIDLNAVFTKHGLPATLNNADKIALINRIRKSGISSEDIAPYARAEQVVRSVGIRREKVPYVIAAIKRASLIAGLNGTGVTLSPASETIVTAELSKVGVALTTAQKIILLNSLPNENIPHTHLRASQNVLAGTRDASRPEYQSMVVDRLFLQQGIDRTKPFTAAEVAPMRAIIQTEFQKIGININRLGSVWTDHEVAEVIEKVRSAQDLSRIDMLPQSNDAISLAVHVAGYTGAEKIDAVTALQDIAPRLRASNLLTVPITDVLLSGTMVRVSATREITLEDHLKNVLHRATGIPAPGVLDAGKLADLVNAANPDLRRDVASSTHQKVDLISQVTSEFLKYDGSYHDAAVLGVVMAELDTATVDQIRQAMEQVFHHRENRDIGHIISRIPDPPRRLVGLKVAHIIRDGVNGFVDIYNRQHPPGGLRFKDIPAEAIRQNAGLVLAHRLGAPAHPFPGNIAEEVQAHRDLFHAHMNQVQLERAAASLDATFWGLEGAQLTYEIEKKLGGDRFRQEALRYTQMIQERRTKQGFPQVAPTNSP